MILREIILVLLFLVGNSMVGMLFLPLFGRKQENGGGNWILAKALLLGTGCLFAMFACLTFFIICRGGTFGMLYRMFLVVYVLVTVTSVVLLLAVKPLRRFLFVSLLPLKTRDCRKEGYLLLGLFLLIGVTYFIHCPLLESRFDLPERMSTLEAADRFCGVNPLTGEETGEISYVQQWCRGVLPAWYLFFSTLFRLPSYRLLFQVVPLWTLSLSMGAYLGIAQTLFQKKRKAVCSFMVFFTLLTLCGNGAYMNPSYGLLHYAYEEFTLISSVVIPVVFAGILAGINKGRKG